MGFRYLGDHLFQGGCLLYALNRWVIKPHVESGVLHSYFNDLLLIPCALPVMLYLHRRLGLRTHDDPPTMGEVALHLITWSVLFEGVGPRWMSHTTADFFDVFAYCAGAAFALLWWNRTPSEQPKSNELRSSCKTLPVA